MSHSTFYRGISLFLLVPVFVLADSKPAKTRPMSDRTRLELVRLLSSEYAFIRKPLPRGEKVIVIKPNGEVTPSDKTLAHLAAQRGQVARAGDRVQITNVEFVGKYIVLEFNGGPVKKAKWYQRIQIGGGGATTPIAQGPDQTLKGASMLIEFKDNVPEMSLADLREIMKPLLDFTVKSAAQAYAETLPKNVQDAIRDHRVLVGMTKEMVTYAKGRPPQRVREKDENKVDYEEWIFGAPPSDVEFVRFMGDEVVQLKIMKIGGERIVRTEKEVILARPEPVETAQKPAEAAPATAPSGAAPTLRRPGEVAPSQPGRLDTGPSNTKPGNKPKNPQDDPPPPPPPYFVVEADD